MKAIHFHLFITDVNSEMIVYDCGVNQYDHQDKQEHRHLEVGCHSIVHRVGKNVEHNQNDVYYVNEVHEDKPAQQSLRPQLVAPSVLKQSPPQS